MRCQELSSFLLVGIELALILLEDQLVRARRDFGLDRAQRLDFIEQSIEVLGDLAHGRVAVERTPAKSSLHVFEHPSVLADIGLERLEPSRPAARGRVEFHLGKELRDQHLLMDIAQPQLALRHHGALGQVLIFQDVPAAGADRAVLLERGLNAGVQRLLSELEGRQVLLGVLFGPVELLGGLFHGLLFELEQERFQELLDLGRVFPFEADGEPVGLLEPLHRQSSKQFDHGVGVLIGVGRECGVAEHQFRGVARLLSSTSRLGT